MANITTARLTRPFGGFHAVRGVSRKTGEVVTSVAVAWKCDDGMVCDGTVGFDVWNDVLAGRVSQSDKLVVEGELVPAEQEGWRPTFRADFSAITEYVPCPIPGTERFRKAETLPLVCGKGVTAAAQPAQAAQPAKPEVAD